MKRNHGTASGTTTGVVNGTAGAADDRRADDAGSWPTAEQELLLRAALLRGPEALDAWRAWRSRVDVELIDHASGRLLPLVYKNLLTHDVADPLMRRLKGAYRLTWTKNQLLFRGMAQVLQGLHAARVETLVLKGAAFIVQHYRDFGVRHTSDFDVLVRTEQTSLAVQLLLQAGLTPKRGSVGELDQAMLSFDHGYPFIDAVGRNLDLHWHVLPQCTYPGADDAFWEGSVPMEMQGVATRALNPADELLHVCLHGSEWSGIAPIHWVADATTILKDDRAQVDWDRLVDQARERLLVVAVREALGYLRQLLDAPVPPEVLRALHAIPVSRAERVEQRFRLASRDETGHLPVFLFRYRRYSRLSGRAAVPGHRLGLLAFLQYVWGIDRPWKVPFCALTKLVRRCGRAMEAQGRRLVGRSAKKR